MAPQTVPVPQPEITPLTEPYWSGLAAGELRFQRCGACGHAWLPARAACPGCLAPEPGWQPASGRAQLVSWVTYRQAVHPAFAERLPYTVGVVELEEGPRLIAGLDVEASGDPGSGGTDVGLRIDQPLLLRIVDEGGTAVPRFVPSPDLQAHR